ncbi:hypothetical protein [Lacrimispora sp. 38-1]|uniref:hypothetical protein n=1 Tax=Lacrimispora sp. 38-1 TaxID=3125778 RepID=UPI003CEECA14
MALIEEGQKVLILRYGKKKDCIDKHIEVIKENGYCWFGKIGIIPSAKAIKAIQDEDAPKIVLYSQGKGFVADVTEISYEKPQEGYPAYYQTELFDELVFPKSYYKLTSIEPLDGNELDKLRIVSSGNRVLDTLNRSMSSFFFAECGKTRPMPVIKKKTTQPKKKEIDINNCAYREDGMCGHKGFVNYKYECERPSSCRGQKR